MSPTLPTSPSLLTATQTAHGLVQLSTKTPSQKPFPPGRRSLPLLLLTTTKGWDLFLSLHLCLSVCLTVSVCFFLHLSLSEFFLFFLVVISLPLFLMSLILPFGKNIFTPVSVCLSDSPFSPPPVASISLCVPYMHKG